jgi:chemotaxis protein CheX
MNVKFLNPFVEAAFEVLTSEMKGAIERGELRLENGPYKSEDVTVILALVGAVEGSVFYSTSALTATQMASAILGERIESFNPLAQSGIAELGNVITGRASMKLSRAGFEATISPPSLIIGKGAQISTLEMPRLLVPLITSFGMVRIHLSLRQRTITSMTTAQMAVPKAPF